MTALPPAGHLRDELVEAVAQFLAGCSHDWWTSMDQEEADGWRDDARRLLDLPVVARALTEARADELEQAAHLLDDGDEQAIEVALGGAPYVHRVLCDRATSLRASIRQTDERNDR